MEKKLGRRGFIQMASVAGAGLTLGVPHIVSASNTANTKPAILGGPKAHPGAFPGWPVFDDTEKKALLDVLQSGNWGRLGADKTVAKFEREYENLLGVKNCLAVSSGTSALYTMLGALDIGPGDEVIIPPYTFVATYNVVVLNYALPVFVDTDIETFQIDADKINDAVTRQTKVIMPVHIGGSPANLDKLVDIAGKANIPLIEDACQAHLAEWRGRKVGNYGLAGAYSFQSSKNLNSAEGGAIVSNDDQFAKACYSFHNQGQGGKTAAYNAGSSGTRGTNLRITEFQGNILLAQMTRLMEQSNRRSENADYLTKLLNEIPGVAPAKLYDGVTRSAYHLYMFRYDKEQFAGLDRNDFLKALRAEGVSCSGGYGTLNRDAYVTGLAKNKHYLRIYGEQVMNDWLEKNHCPQNDKLCEEAVWFTQTILLGTKSDMEQIAEAIGKIKKHAVELVKVSKK
jgi:perosamine synthetase